MRSRAASICVLVSALMAGMLFGTVFGVAGLVLPLTVVCLLAFGVTEACRRLPALAAWRPMLICVAGLIGVCETVLFGTTAGGLPTGATLTALTGGLDSWQATLQSTWPARADAELVLFVPYLTIVACAAGIELLHRVRPPLVALLPSLAVAVVSQLYDAAGGVTGLLAGIGLAAIAAVLLATSADRAGLSGLSSRLVAALRWAPAMVTAIVIGACLLVVAAPAGRPAYTIQQEQEAPAPGRRIAHPLTDVARRLTDPRTEVFRYRTTAAVDRWRLAVFDTFDGVTWTSATPYRVMGSRLEPGDGVRVPTDLRTATVTGTGGDLTGPWLPSQPWPESVDGLAPLVDEATGALRIREASRPGDVGYTLSWRTPRATRDDLLRAAVDPAGPGGLTDIGAVPAGVVELARQATGDLEPSFHTALKLERYLRKHYRVVAGRDLPTGHSWPQLARFLQHTGPVDGGTSEQFAAAYVLLARLNGIPARLAVGFRAPAQPVADGTYVVHNGDALAWPEVAVDGLGWWPLDPTESASRARPGAGTQAAVTEEAGDQVPTTEPTRPPTTQPEPPDDSDTPTSRDDPPIWLRVVPVVLAAVLAAALLVVLAIPVTRAARVAVRRRRRGSAAVVAAWTEARDRLRAHGVRTEAGMTVRDLVRPAGRIGGRRAVAGLNRLAVAVDATLWSGRSTTDAVAGEAWAAVREVRRGLRDQPVASRIRAAFHLRSLLRPR